MEIWKDIKGYEGIYQASSLGQIKRINHTKYNIASSTVGDIVNGRSWKHVQI